MAKKKKKLVFVKPVFHIMIFSALLYLILGQLLLPRELGSSNYKCTTYNDGWNLVTADEQRIPISIPCTCEAERLEIVTIENTLPDTLEDNIYLCFRSVKHDLKFYINDELRHEYSTKDTRLFGKTSAPAYIFMELKPTDAGKTIRIETCTDSSYTGIFYPIYYGEKLGIWSMFSKQYGIEFATAGFMLVMGIITIVASLLLQFFYRKKFDLQYLGWGILIASLWIIANSTFRQLIFPNVSVIGDMTFLMIMLMAIPFMLFLDGIQKEQYHKIYVTIETIAILNGILCTTLHITNIKDFADTILWMAIICVIAIVIMIITIILDIFQKRIKDYYLVAIGILGLSVSAVIQIYVYFQRTIKFSGTIIACGLIFLLICSVFNTIFIMRNLEQERTFAISANQSKGKFLANMSHEIRTPINAVLGMDAMILRETKDEQIKSYAMDIQNAGNTLLSLINDILDFSKIESGKMEIIPVEYDFSSLIHDISNMIIAKAQNKNLKFHIRIDSQLPYKLYGDEVRIRQVLVNLLTNAVKYTNEGSITLSVSGTRQDESIVLEFSVSDTGIGIKEEDIPKLFEEFERIEEKRNRNIEGTGLGMNITTQLLQMMNSKLEVESTYGAGSTFSFKLEQTIIDHAPIGNLEERMKQLSSSYHYDAVFTAPDSHILVVDDNDMNRKVFINLLKETKLKIDEASGGQACLDLVFQKHYDLIFLDHMMPELDGVETLHLMKQNPDYPCKDTPVIVLTANAISGAKEQYIKEGFDDFLSKPVVPEKLEKKICEWLPKEQIHYEQIHHEQLPAPSGCPEPTNTSNASTSDIHPDIEELPVIDGLDWAYGKMHLQDLLLDTVKEFYRTIDSEANLLEQYYQSIPSDATALNAYRIKVHAMKSSAALIGLIPLSGLAKVLEFAARDGIIATIENLHSIFISEWRSYKEKLSLFAEKTEEKHVYDTVIIGGYLSLLSKAMTDMDIDIADETIQLLRQYQYPAQIEAVFEQLDTAVTNLDNDLAIDLITRLQELLVEEST